MLIELGINLTDLYYSPIRTIEQESVKTNLMFTIVVLHSICLIYE